jgi:hypothetical protein
MSGKRGGEDRADDEGKRCPSEHAWFDVAYTEQLRTRRPTREVRTPQTDSQPNACLDQRPSHARPDNSPPIRAA